MLVPFVELLCALRYDLGRSPVLFTAGDWGYIVARWIGLIGSSCIAGVLGFAISTPGFSQATSNPGERQQAISQPNLVETQWNLIELNGAAVNAPEGQGLAHIYLQKDGYKLSGSDGCNRLFGSYDLSGSSLQFHSVAQTLMACPGAFTDRAAEFTEALKLVTSFQVTDDVLQLKAEDRVLARFQARKK